MKRLLSEDESVQISRRFIGRDSVDRSSWSPLSFRVIEERESKA